MKRTAAAITADDPPGRHHGNGGDHRGMTAAPHTAATPSAEYAY